MLPPLTHLAAGCHCAALTSQPCPFKFLSKFVVSKSNTFTPLSSPPVTNLFEEGEKETSFMEHLSWASILTIGAIVELFKTKIEEKRGLIA